MHVRPKPSLFFARDFYRLFSVGYGYEDDSFAFVFTNGLLTYRLADIFSALTCLKSTALEFWREWPALEQQNADNREYLENASCCPR